MIVGGALLLDRVANFHSSLSSPSGRTTFAAFVDEVCRFSSRQDFEDDGCMVAVERAGS